MVEWTTFNIVVALLIGQTALFLLWCLHINRAMSGTPEDARKLAPTRWTEEQIRAEYERVKRAPTDVRPYLPPKQGRRYVVVGGSGFVGGWVVKHLLMRGEDPAAIRILDLQPPKDHGINDSNSVQVDFVQTDISDETSVQAAFGKPWPEQVAQLPLTVFHHAAFVRPYERAVDFLEPYMRVNLRGTRNIIKAAKGAGASVLVATSSASVGIRPPQYFLPPWRWWPSGWFQLSINGDNAGRKTKNGELVGCYTITKVLAEVDVMEADSKEENFRTGVIRPGHGIHGHGTENLANLTYAYLKRGGAASWLHPIVSNFVDAQNVSVAHLQFEKKLLSKSPSDDIGGRAYTVCDPNGPIVYGDLYNTLTKLAQPATSIAFPKVPPVPMLLLAYLVESYVLLRHRYLDFLPAVTGDLLQLQPALFHVCTLHLVYDDSKSKTELGFKAPITTLEGLCLQMLEWNAKQAAKLNRGENVEAAKTLKPVGPVAPDTVGN